MPEPASPTPQPTPTPTQQPTPSDKPIVAFFDVDNTLMRGASVFHVARGAFKRGYLSVRDLVSFGRTQFSFVRRGENIDHMTSARARALELTAGHDVAELHRLAEDIYDKELRSRLWPETVRLAEEHLAKGHEVWLITATPADIADVLVRRLGLTGALATRMEHADGKFTGRLAGAFLHGTEKAVAARELVESLGADLADCWAYSDSRNDIPLLELVGNRVVVNPDLGLKHHADQHGWEQLHLDPSSIREARRRVRREARTVRKNTKRQVP